MLPDDVIFIIMVDCNYFFFLINVHVRTISKFADMPQLRLDKF